MGGQRQAGTSVRLTDTPDAESYPGPFFPPRIHRNMVIPLKRLRLATLAALTAFVAPEVSTAAPATLRVLTFNVWGIWGITPSREARIAAIGPAVARLQPDLVAFQEVWVDADADRLARDLRAAGLPHTRRFTSTWPGHSGLMIASRYPIERTAFLEYDEGTHPSIPWHVDWIAGKGIAVTRVRTPFGPVNFANTHVQAAYGDVDAYDTVQLAQLLQAAEFLDGPGEIPLVIAGDLNVTCDSYVFRAFALRSGASPSDPNCGIDSISARPGADQRLVPTEVTKVLTEDVSLEDGQRRPLSDHPAVLAVFQPSPVESRLAGLSISPTA